VPEARQVTAEDGQVVVPPRAVAGRPPGMGHALRLVPRRTAIVIIDVQRYFLDTPPFAAMRETVRPIANFLPAAREAGITVVHLRTEFLPDLVDAGRLGSRTRQMMDGTGAALVRGAPLTDGPAELAPAESDIVVTKTRFSGFWGSRLNDVLRARNIDSLILTGGTTTVCVESTLRDAVFLEYNGVVFSDCARDITPELHEAALERIDLFFGWVCDSAEFSAALRMDAQ